MFGTHFLAMGPQRLLVWSVAALHLAEASDFIICIISAADVKSHLRTVFFFVTIYKLPRVLDVKKLKQKTAR